MAALLGFSSGCAEDDPTPTDSGVSVDTKGAGDRGVGDDASGDAPKPCRANWGLPDVQGDNPSCPTSADDYVVGSTTDPYDACVSDDDTYHRFNPSIGSIGRVAGFTKIAEKLWRADGTRPTAADFSEARVIFAENEGLQSRLERREDEHYPAAAKKCADMDATELAANADRCVGPAKIQPLLNAAFVAGGKGEDVLKNAARIEAALLWFLYVSVHKEATTCTNKQKDCDSSYAYFSGGEAEGAGLGLARYLRTVSPQATGRVWDGILAVRCWRDLDQAVPATNLTLRDKAIGQLDRALLRGMAVLVKSRLEAFRKETCAESREALWAGLQILGGVLDREAQVRDAKEAGKLKTELQKAADAADTTVIDSAIDNLFPCP
ncbi:MAG: hypothetical protein CSA24_02805 [Deltaproteobacteria bacterium]|nr:MAG: hypothetical protein CSB49_03265 [Pseudomonadota bacterium]PIE65223.1 MAG: hypothetical protein CSA24_02805 [Deltaproteobacteria bacterium]